MKIILTAPGILAVGEFLPGIPYDVDDAEAERLIAVKGFQPVQEPPLSSTQNRRGKPAGQPEE